jgi:hypothetical protein
MPMMSIQAYYVWSAGASDFSTLFLHLEIRVENKVFAKYAKQTIFKNNPPNSGHLGKFTCNSYQTVSLQTRPPAVVGITTMKCSTATLKPL